jgi:hypothetical protein
LNTFKSNAAVTLRAAVMLTVHDPLDPEHAPLQPAKLDPAVAVAVSVTLVAYGKLAVHADPHAMPAGALATEPPPLPVSATVSAGVTASNCAVTARARSATTVHVEVVMPAHAPPHAANVEPVLATAVSVTLVPYANVAVQLEPHEIPDGELDTAPVPVPVSETSTSGVSASKVAIALRAWSIVSVQVAVVPLHAPDQPVNVEPVPAVAVSMTVSPKLYACEQVPPHEMPAPVDATVPVPVPARVTVKVGVNAANVALTLRA